MADKATKKAKALGAGPGTLHPDYIMNRSRWARCRDCHDGADAVKAQRETYLPKPGGFDVPDQYDLYLMRAGFLPAVQRTEEVLSGLLFGDDPEVKMPGELDEVVENVTLTGQDLIGLAQDMVSELLTTGRVAVQLDFATPTPNTMRPYWRLRSAENLINWRTMQQTDGREVLVRAMLREDTLVEDPKNAFGLILERRIRELILAEAGVEIRLHALRKDKWEQVGPTRRPMAYGQPLMEIPLLISSARTVGVDVGRPPLLPIANLVLSHYRSSADLEQGNFFASLPTAYVKGAKMSVGQRSIQQAQPQSIRQGKPGGPQTFGGAYPPSSGLDGYRLGSGLLLELPEDADIGYLEISGPGLVSIHRTLEMKEKQLQSIGARLIADQSRNQSETAQTARIRAQSDAALMRLIANVVDKILTTALKISARWLGLPDADVSVRLDRSALSPPEEPGKGPDLSIDNWPTE